MAAAASACGAGRTGESGGVRGPVGTSVAGPADSRARGQAESLGQHRCGQVSSQVGEGGAPAGGRLDAEAAQTLAELAGSERQPRVEATEQPSCCRRRPDTGIRAAFVDEPGTARLTSPVTAVTPGVGTSAGGFTMPSTEPAGSAAGG
jgi:hypothetical protein